jgi:hypothetical protein
VRLSGDLLERKPPLGPFGSKGLADGREKVSLLFGRRDLDCRHAEILYPSGRYKQPARQFLDEPHLFGVRLRGPVGRLHDHRNPR